MSAARQETPMFPARVKPARVGPYRTERGFQNWNGRWWGWAAKTPAEAVQFNRYRSLHQAVQWCGLAQAAA